MDGALARRLRHLYGAYVYLARHDLGGVSVTSRLLHERDGRFLAGRVRDELGELEGVLAGTHGHSGGRDDVLLEASQALYWTILWAITMYAPSDADSLWRALQAETTAEGDGMLVDCDSAEGQRRFLAAALGRIGRLCRQAGVSVADVVQRDLRDMQAKPYLAPYWRAVQPGTVWPRESIGSLAPYDVGPPIPDGAARLHLNEHPWGASPWATEAIAREAARVNRYPDDGPRLLRARLAADHGTSEEHIALGSGSDELIGLLTTAYLEQGDRAILADPPYGVQRKAVLTVGACPIGVPLREDVHDLDAMAAAIDGTTRIVFVTNPHNPTGTHVERAALRRFVAAVPSDVLIAIDEAYYHFVAPDERHTAIDLLGEHANIVVLRTFSKVHGLAGVRIGYAVACPDVTAVLDRVRSPFNLNRLAVAAALAALDDQAHIDDAVRRVTAGRARLVAIARTHGLIAVSSATNFVLMRIAGASDLARALVAHGVLVRDGATLGIPDAIRVSVGTDEEMERLERALATTCC